VIQRFVIMGVSGCGKTSVGEDLAAMGLVAFIDGDALHPQSNVDKMASGVPLTTEDRLPWLREVGAALGASTKPTAIGCSALQRSYRDLIRETAGHDVAFLHLHAEKPVLAARVAARTDHFMPPSLLDSQFAALEHLDPDETGRVIDITPPLPEVIAQAQRYIEELRA
jgi:carbohydrate kinase (thermoresistant glucokinase family)